MWPYRWIPDVGCRSRLCSPRSAAAIGGQGGGRQPRLLTVAGLSRSRAIQEGEGEIRCYTARPRVRRCVPRRMNPRGNPCRWFRKTLKCARPPVTTGCCCKIQVVLDLRLQRSSQISVAKREHRWSEVLPQSLRDSRSR